MVKLAKTLAAAVAGLLLTGCVVAVGASPALGRPPRPAASAPVFAYYYMWMWGSYWSRNKTDYPTQPFPGNYRSDDLAVIEWQMVQAKAAGITGFLVAWKDTQTYRRILPLVEEAALRQNFWLAMHYESLDASNTPLPVSTVAADFTYFVATYAPHAVWYRVNGKPLTVFHDTRWFTGSEISSITRPVRSRIKVLSSAHSVAEYYRVAPYTDGDAYYWPAVNPSTNPGFANRLRDIGAAVHKVNVKIWIAPIAPGFDATLIGGHIVAPRNNGDTLRLRHAAAAASGADLIGLISWNEFTENTHLEPSINYGDAYVRLMASLATAAVHRRSARPTAPTARPGLQRCGSRSNCPHR